MFKTKNGQYHIFWRGWTDEHTGYGSSNTNLLRALGKAGVHTHGPDDPKADECEVGVAYGPGGLGDLEKLPTPYRILYTMFEADKVPETWLNAANCANQVWVPSEFCRQALLGSGCDAPIRVVPLGVDPDVYHPAQSVIRNPKCEMGNSDGAEEDIFTVGFAGAWTIRKGCDLLERAFLEEFEGQDDVRLIIRSSSILSSTAPKDPRITVLEGKRSADEMRQFYQGLDLLVLPTHGEGFGLTPCEAMACGAPVAVTDWGGSVDYLGEPGVHSMRIAIDGLESCGEYHGVKGGKWAKPSLTSIRWCLRWAYEHPEELARIGEAGAKHILSNFTYAHSARRIRDLLKTVDPSERVEVESTLTVTWKGDPRWVTTPVGGFERNIPRIMTEAQYLRLSEADRNAGNFVRETRYKRSVG